MLGKTTATSPAQTATDGSTHTTSILATVVMNEDDNIKSVCFVMLILYASAYEFTHMQLKMGELDNALDQSNINQQYNGEVDFVLQYKFDSKLWHHV